jgi:hypothetical protein
VPRAVGGSDEQESDEKYKIFHGCTFSACPPEPRFRLQSKRQGTVYRLSPKIEPATMAPVPVPESALSAGSFTPFGKTRPRVERLRRRAVRGSVFQTLRTDRRRVFFSPLIFPSCTAP